MCLAIFKPAGVELPEQSIRSGWIGNPDGGGYAFVKEGSIVVRKNFGKLAEFYAAYKKDAEENAGSPFVVHFRIRSMGDRSLDNTPRLSSNMVCLSIMAHLLVQEQGL